MNILFSFCNVINPHRGGTERVTHLVSEYLRQQGHTIFFLCTKEQSSPYTPPSNTHFLPQHGSIKEKAMFVNELCLKKSIDVVINEGGVTDDVYFLSKEYLPDSVKVITCIHFDICTDLKYFYRNYNYSLKGLSVSRQILKLIQIVRLPFLKKYHTRNRIERYRYAAKNSDYIIVPAEALISEFKLFTGLNKINNILHIPNPNSLRLSSNNHIKEKLILYVGRLEYEKRVDRILRAWKHAEARFPDWHIEIAGSGSDEMRLIKLCERHSISRVYFLGHQNDVKKLYERAAIFILASDYESFSMVLLEALSNACYPIIYDFPAAKQLLADDTWGSRIESHSEHDLASALCAAMMGDKNNIANFQDIKIHLQRFSMTEIGKNWLRVIQ